MNQTSPFGEGVVEDGGADRRLHAGLPREVDVELGGRHPEVGHELRREHRLKIGFKL